MKQFHHYTPELYHRPSKLEYAVFGFTLVLFSVLLGLLLLLPGCASPALPGQTPAEAKLDAAQSRQLSAASASVEAAGRANSANPDGAPKAAVAGELTVAQANLPPPSVDDSRAALTRVNAALSGQLAEAQKGWDAATARAQTLDAQITTLQKQVVAERAAAAAAQRKSTDRLCVVAALLVGSALFIAAALSLAAGMYFTLPKLEYGALGLALGGAVAFFAATQVGSPRFNLLALVVLVGGVATLIYTVWSGFSGGAVLKIRAGGFDSALAAIRHFAGEVAADAETGAEKLWRWLGIEMDAAHKALVTDWQKLEAAFTAKPAKSN
jgi:outer membrane murein-binding lipoprotein Lpp